MTRSYCAVPKSLRRNSTHYFILKIQNKRKLQQSAFNHSSDIHFKDFMNLYKKCTPKPCSFLVINATPASNNPPRFRESLLEKM